MTEAKHTPGPWTAIVEKPTRRDPAGSMLVSTGAGTQAIDAALSGAVPEESMANARLIAAAPDLLDALQWIADLADKQYEQDEKLRSNGARTLIRISDRARAAVAKATGGA